MNFCIVVARYNENLEWTKNFLNVIVYNKGNPLSDDFNHFALNNVGREGHTYYKHIYDNYDNLTDYIIFLQTFSLTRNYTVYHSEICDSLGHQESRGSRFFPILFYLFRILK